MNRRVASFVVASVLALTASTAATGAPPAVAADELPPGFTDSLVTNVAAPTDMAFVPGSSSILITTQPGRLYLHNPAIGNTVVLDLVGRICTNSERGLLGIALDPAFGASGGFVYLYYTFPKFGVCVNNTSSAPVNRVSRFTAGPDLSISLASEVVLVDNIPSPAGNHNGGDLHIASDNLLYASVGDGGCKIGDASRCASQNDNARFLSILSGKILRVNLNGTPAATNPWAGVVGARRCGDPAGVPPGTVPCAETFNWGLRNPFRMGFRPASTTFHINDVGQGTWEEIDEGIAGADYGWNIREGHCATGSTTNCGAPPAGMTNPIYDYGRGSGCASITGGAFVPAGVWPAEYQGAYMYADYVCGRIFRLSQDAAGTWTSTEFTSGLGGSSAVALSFGPSAAGQSLYYTSYAGGGQLRRIDFAQANQAPTAMLSANPMTGTAPLDVTFDGNGSSDPDGDPLTYNFAFGDGGTAQQTTPVIVHRYASAGSFTASLTVSDGRGGVSAPVTRLIQVDGGPNTPPTPTIQAPGPADLFSVGQQVTLQGSASDVQDGTLPPSALTWRVILHHDAHTHPFLGPVTGNGIPFTAPAPEDLLAATNSYLEIELTAQDSSGLTTTVTRNFQPRKVNLTFATNPSGLAVTVSGTSVTGPTAVVSWHNWALNVNAPDQTAGGRLYRFQNWSDGGARAHTIVTPATPTTYTVKFKRGGKN